MSELLIYFALPVATVILAIVLQKIIKSPILVAATAFAIYLIITFAVFDEGFLIYAIIYTLLAYLAALITRFICCLIKNGNNPCLNQCNNDNNGNTDDANIIQCGCGCNCNNLDCGCILNNNSQGFGCGLSNNQGCGCGTGNNQGCGCNNNQSLTCNNRSSKNSLIIRRKRF